MKGVGDSLHMLWMGIWVHHHPLSLHIATLIKIKAVHSWETSVTAGYNQIHYSMVEWKLYPTQNDSHILVKHMKGV